MIKFIFWTLQCEHWSTWMLISCVYTETFDKCVYIFSILNKCTYVFRILELDIDIILELIFMHIIVYSQSYVNLTQSQHISHVCLHCRSNAHFCTAVYISGMFTLCIPTEYAHFCTCSMCIIAECEQAICVEVRGIMQYWDVCQLSFNWGKAYEDIEPDKGLIIPGRNWLPLLTLFCRGSSYP